MCEIKKLIRKRQENIAAAANLSSSVRYEGKAQERQ